MYNWCVVMFSFRPTGWLISCVESISIFLRNTISTSRCLVTVPFQSDRSCHNFRKLHLCLNIQDIFSQLSFIFDAASIAENER